MDLDDWDLSAEELDSLEKDAIRQIAERNSSSARATCSRSHPSTDYTISPSKHFSNHRPTQKVRFLSLYPLGFFSKFVLTVALLTSQSFLTCWHAFT